MLLNLSILTLNVWGIPFPFVSKDREARIAAIGVELNTGNYDIVSLQEIWSRKDCEDLKKATEAVLPYSHYFFSGVIGSGLLVLSKYPILSTFFHPWSVNGYFHRIHHADWFGGKGVGLCRILVDKYVVHLYNTHLHAEYNTINDDYKTHRVIQAFDTAQFIRATRGDSVLQVLAGDLNAQSHDLSYKVLLYISKMQDCCTSKDIVTNGYYKNSYTPPPKANGNKTLGIHIDHIFARSSENFDFDILEYGLALAERVPNQNFSYSDHEAVLARINLSDCRESVGEGTCLIADKLSLTNGERRKSCEVSLQADECLIARRITVLQEAISLCEMSLDQLHVDRIFYYSVAAIFAFILVAFLEYPAPGFRTLCIILKFLISGILLFCIFMGSVWNYMEWNGILSGKVAMELCLRSIVLFEGNGKNGIIPTLQQQQRLTVNT